MKKIRVIARLDVKGPNVIKGIQFECLRVMGKPREMAQLYYLQGADELLYLDTVANLYQRQNLVNIVNQASESISIPFTIGGGVRTLEDIQVLLRAGADKVAINTAATKDPDLIKRAANMFGSQCIVVSIEAKKKPGGTWEAYVDNGRQSTGLDAVEWAKTAEELGAGEIVLTSVDMDGTERGMDIDLIKRVSEAVSISLVASGGVGDIEDFARCIKECNVDAVAAASVFHYKKYSIAQVKEALLKESVHLRRTTEAQKVYTNPQQEYDIVNYNKYTLNQLKDELSNKDNDTARANINICTESGPDDYSIGVIDYGLNNLKSVIKGFEKIGAKAKIINTPDEILNSEYLVLPGVGTFEYGMRQLEKMNLIEPLKTKAAEGAPVLGICLGMQLLFSESEEFGLHKGLGLISGRVIPFKAPGQVNQPGYKVPHIGWNEIRIPARKNTEKLWENTILQNTPLNSSVYFVHSLYPVPDDENCVIAQARYGAQDFCAVVKKDNITAAQFHPERSGEVGLEMLRAFYETGKVLSNT